MDIQWKLDEDDNILDGFALENVIDTLDLYYGKCVIDEATVRRAVDNILSNQLQDMNFLLENNMDEIIKAVKGRG